ncbi:hypothetical protein NtRootA1_28740 [Arthrobacter sp. NtRootA1]|nr:hypothetical protein NtRootA1_28740 [Arthrobacter sp. NtRootA1]
MPLNLVGRRTDLTFGAIGPCQQLRGEVLLTNAAHEAFPGGKYWQNAHHDASIPDLAHDTTIACQRRGFQRINIKTCGRPADGHFHVGLGNAR